MAIDTRRLQERTIRKLEQGREVTRTKAAARRAEAAARRSALTPYPLAMLLPRDPHFAITALWMELTDLSKYSNGRRTGMVKL